MLQLDAKNLLIEDAFLEAFDTDYVPATLDRIITDFDFTTYHISTPESKEKLIFSINIKCWNDLVKYGVFQILKDKYDELIILTEPEAGWNFSLYVDLTQFKLANDENKKELASRLSLLKSHCFSAPFYKAFNRHDILAAEGPVDPNNIYGEDTSTVTEEVFVLNYRDSEVIYIKPSNDRVTVIFSTVFRDETDKVFSKVFLQEFSDARKRSIQTAPQVINSHREPPLEIRNLTSNPFNETTGEEKTYITFVLFPRHFSSVDVRWNTIQHIQLFRSYFHYHIKIVKCFLHQRMRYRVSEFMKVLNRARQDSIDEEKERKTVSGRRFELRS
ncbi:hypothetical protein LJB42_004155 [Komagataella kurtzmanii]|nr:hypothetical protein LJB42_004155 [Komagataella kurtzmanii]